jgi:hypothetical protein
MLPNRSIANCTVVPGLKAGDGAVVLTELGANARPVDSYFGDGARE